MTPLCWTQTSATGAVWRRCYAVETLLVYPSSLIPVLAASLSRFGTNNHSTGVRAGCCPSSRVSWCQTPTASTTPPGLCFSHLQLLNVVPHCRLGSGPCSMEGTVHDALLQLITMLWACWCQQSCSWYLSSRQDRHRHWSLAAPRWRWLYQQMVNVTLVTAELCTSCQHGALRSHWGVLQQLSMRTTLSLNHTQK